VRSASSARRRRRDSFLALNSANTFLHFTFYIIKLSTVNNKITAKVVGQHVLSAQCSQEIWRSGSVDPLILKLGKR